MSYDLSVHLKGLNDQMIPDWLAEIRKFNMDAEIFPAFSFQNHSGFLPFKIVVHDCPNKRLNNLELLTGFEWYAEQIDLKNKKKGLFSKLFDKNQRLSSIEMKLKEAETLVHFGISAHDSFEMRAGWYAAASLALIGNGVLTDYQEDIQLEGQILIRHASNIVIENEQQITDHEWRTHEFEEWIG
ncbi:hypothetical protein [Paenibacillus sp. JDR-2]|uniref:hypothetical protein n=1 Tax=Paenibacillus sp. (strain JDR-2) TaxID=324057 RepID=UPI000166692E|nr:hypothetical protein [Paenibacillus sp. JDR-2]ACT01714.1 hypothetical protein Pjdr2_3069 [Paenibacillus sp. JDR-2]